MDGSITSEGLDWVELSVDLTQRLIGVGKLALTGDVVRGFTF